MYPCPVAPPPVEPGRRGEGGYRIPANNYVAEGEDLPLNLDAYLARIGLDSRPPATFAGLTALHHAHLTAISYENLDVQLGRPLTIERPAIYDKIVGRRRGGWCYEMNGIFG